MAGGIGRDIAGTTVKLEKLAQCEFYLLFGIERDAASSGWRKRMTAAVG